MTVRRGGFSHHDSRASGPAEHPVSGFRQPEERRASAGCRSRQAAAGAEPRAAARSGDSAFL